MAVGYHAELKVAVTWSLVYGITDSDSCVKQTLVSQSLSQFFFPTTSFPPLLMTFTFTPTVCQCVCWIPHCKY